MKYLITSVSGKTTPCIENIRTPKKLLDYMNEAEWQAIVIRKPNDWESDNNAIDLVLEIYDDYRE